MSRTESTTTTDMDTTTKRLVLSARFSMSHTDLAAATMTAMIRSNVMS